MRLPYLSEGSWLPGSTSSSLCNKSLDIWGVSTELQDRESGFVQPHLRKDSSFLVVFTKSEPSPTGVSAPCLYLSFLFSLHLLLQPHQIYPASSLCPSEDPCPLPSGLGWGFKGKSPRLKRKISSPHIEILKTQFKCQLLSLDATSPSTLPCVFIMSQYNHPALDYATCILFISL